MRFAFIHVEKASFSISALCRVLGVTRQGYYAWAGRAPSARARSEEVLRAHVRRLHATSRGTYGSPRIRAALRGQRICVSKRRVERLMREESLSGCPRKRFRRTTVRDASHAAAPNLLARCFVASRPDERWVSDITYVRTDSGFSYLAVIVDLYSRAVVGWSLERDLSHQLVLQALGRALRHRRPAGQLLHHSDQGCQYTSRAYQHALAQAGMTVSMSRVGNCWDNAVAESFFATIKRELLDRQSWTSTAALRHAVFEYIDVYYNRERLHSSLNYRTPAQIERHYHAAQTA
jgi:putative transposase